MGFNTNILIGLLLVSAVSIVFSLFLLETSINYDVEVPDQYDDIFNDYEAAQSEYDKQQKIIEGGAVEKNGVNEAIYSNVVVMAKQSQQAFRLLTKMISNWFAMIPTPVAISSIIISIVGILSMIGFMTVITRRAP